MAKRVKWKNAYDVKWGASLSAGHALLIGKSGADFVTFVCGVGGAVKKKSFKSLKAAQRYCIQEAQKLHKTIGTQLDQLAKEAE